MTGYTEEELRGVHILDLTSAEHRHENQGLLDGLRNGTLSKFPVQKRMRHKQGHWIWVRVTVSTIPSIDGAAYSWHGNRRGHHGAQIGFG